MWFKKRTIKEYPNIEELNLKKLPEDFVWHIMKITQRYRNGEISASQAMKRISNFVERTEEQLGKKPEDSQ